MTKINATCEPGQLFPFDGAQVAFSPRSRSLLLLNDSAALIWQSFERGANLTAAARELSAQFAIPMEVAERDATVAYDALKRQQLAAQRRAGTDEDWFGYRMMVGKLEDRGALKPPDLIVTLFGERIGLIIPPEMREPIRRMFGSRICDPDGDRTALVVSSSNGLVVVEGAGPSFSVPRTPPEAMPLICQSIFATALKRAGFALVIHAACVRRGDRTFLLPGLSGSGKSTLTAALGRSGFEILADDTTVFLTADGTVSPSAFWLSIKSGSYALLASAYPELADLADCVSRERVVRLLPNQALGTADAQITDIVFPSYRGAADGSMRFQAISRAEALLRITDSGYWFPDGISSAEVGSFLGFIERSSCAELFCSNLETSIALFRRLADE